MFDELQQNQALLEITIIFIVLVGIAIWQQLKLASVIMSGIYFSYLFFNIFDPMDRNLKFNEMSHLDNQTNIIIDTIDELELKDSIDIKEDEPIIEEIKTVLLPKGRIVLWEFKPYPCATINHLIVRGSGSHRLRTHREVETLLKEGGFQNIQPFHIHTPWPPWRNLAYTAYVE